MADESVKTAGSSDPAERPLAAASPVMGQAKGRLGAAGDLLGWFHQVVGGELHLVVFVQFVFADELFCWCRLWRAFHAAPIPGGREPVTAGRLKDF